MPRLLSVNVGLPRDITWRGQTVHTGVWKDPVQGRRIVRRLNVEGDGQGDLAGHGVRTVRSWFIRSTPIGIGRTTLVATISPSGSSARILPLTAWRTTRSA